MKYKYNKHITLLSALLCALFTMTSCSDMVEKSVLDETSSKVKTRSLNATDYYWYNGEQIALNKVPEKKFILFNSSDEKSISNLLQSTYSMNSIQINDVVLSSKIIKKKSCTESLKWSVISTSDNLSTNSQILYEAPCFLTEDGKEASLGFLVYVKLKDAQNLETLEQLAQENGVEIIGNNQYMPLWYTLSCSKKSKGNALEISNKFYESGLFASCQPDLICDDEIACVNDPLFSSQWALNNTGQNGGTAGIDIDYCNARSITEGSSSIIVAVLDQGVDLTHPDINIYSKSYDTESGTSPSRVLGEHGTACAGIISAKANNSLGIAGIAPKCPVMSISNSLASSVDSRQKRADGFNYAWQNGAAVISNSWSSSIKYDIINDAIQAAISNGRNGLGCVIAFAAGNNNNSTVSYPANAISDIIAVGAISPCGERKSPSSCDGETNWGSNYGTALDIMAPGVLIPTTDITGSAGYASGDYFNRFNGTSSACPHVAGIAALVLSVNPSLTQKEVVNIIEKTAKKTGNYSYGTVNGRPNGTWNNEMGYGLLDAYAACAAAESETTIFSNKTVTSNQIVAGRIIQSEDVTVTGGAKLTFAATEQLTINKPFTINLGSQLEILNNQ
mgnify:FL=1